MTQHVPEDLLVAFVDGEVGEQLAIHIAEHLDACPTCLNRAATLEPLAAAFAALPDPVPPPDLAEAVLAAADAPERAPTTELAIGAGLLALAAAVTAVFGSPVSLAADLGLVMSALATGVRAAIQVGGSSIALTACAALALAGFAATARFAEPFDGSDLTSNRRLL